MNMKKQYTAPTLEVVDVEVHLMLNGVSADGDSITVGSGNNEYYDPDNDEII